MPPLEERTQIDDTFTADFTVVRALLRCGRAYDKAVVSFEPYNEIKEFCEHARTGMQKIVERALKTRTSAFVFLINRFEGNAPSTIEAVVGKMPTARGGLSIIHF
jgi:hypothetical protein